MLNTELSTVDSSIVQEKVKEAPMPKKKQLNWNQLKKLRKLLLI
ncbi:hypothetical protein CSB80_2843 [Staphylococcus aureus]|nr:hypothetical protein CSB80_2843 [Staphylococcus aureus]